MFTASKFLALAALCAACSAYAAATTLRVCADPNNLPFSNRAGQGFENHLAEMVAKDLGMSVSYDWYPQRSAFFSKTLNAGKCDVVMGVPSGIPIASTSIPYYRSGYVFISRRDRHLNINSLDDPRLRTLRIGVHITGDEDSNLPPVNALLRRGIVRNLVGYDIYGHLDEKNPPADLIRAVANRQVDIAIAWGPLAGYFALHSAIPLVVTPIDVLAPVQNIPMKFSISMGVRKGDGALLDRLNAEIEKRGPEIHSLLKSYGVPLLAAGAAAQTGY